MSELIDSIYNVEAIQKEIKTIEAYMDGLKNIISTYSVDVKKLYDSARGAKSQDELSKVSKNLNDNLVQGSKVTSEYIKQQEKLKAAQEKLNVINSDANKELIRINLTTRERSELLKAEAVLNDKNAGSLQKAAAMNSKLNIEKKKLNLETEAGQKRLKEINIEQDKNNKLIVDSSNKLEKQKQNVGNYKSAFSGLVTSFKSGEIGLKGLAAGFGKLALSMVTNPIFLVVGALAGLGKLIGSSIKQATDYQFANAELAGVLGVTRKEIMDLQKESQRLGATTAFTALQVTELQTEFARLGFTKNEIKGVTEATVNLSIAAKASTADTAAFVGSTIRGFGLTAEEAARVTDVAAKAYNASALSFEKLSTGLGIVAPAAAAFGDSMESTTAKLGKLSDAGIDASTAGTSLRNIYLELAKKGMTYEEAMQKIATSQDKLSTANDLFGKRGAVAAIVLSNQNDAVKELTTTLENSQGAVKKLADEQLNTIEGSKKLLESAWSGFLFAIEDGNGILSDMWKGILDGLTKIINGFSKAVKFIGEYKEIIGGVVSAIAAYNIAVSISTAKTKLNAIWTKTSGAAQLVWSNIMGVLTGKIKLQAIAQAILNAVKLLDPTAAMIAATLALAGGIAFLIRKMKEQTAAQKAVNDVNNTAQKAIIDQKLEMQKLIDVAKDETKSKEERLAALKKLNEISPKYFGNLTLETINSEAAKKATDNYIESLLQKAKIQAAQDKIAEIEKQRLEDEIDGQTKKVKWYQTESGQKRKAAKEQESYNEQIKALKGIIEENMNAQQKSFVANNAMTDEQLAAIEEEKKAKEEAAKKAKELSEKETERLKKEAKERLDAAQRLKDSELALMSEGEAKQIALSQENLKRKLEDLQAAGQLTTELEKNLTAANGIEIQKIRDDFAKQKADKDLADFEKSIADYEKNLQKEIDLLSVGYKEKETELKKQFANGKIDREKYEADLVNIQVQAGKEANDKTIELLQKELEIANLSADKKAEISNKIKDLQIQNENAVLDATIEANEKAVEDEKSKGEKILEITMQLTDAAMDLFSSIADFQREEAQKRIDELEAEQKKNDETFEARQDNLDKALMSDGNRADAQKKIDEEKARRDKEIADKVKAEKIKQAKWDKAQAYSSAIIGTAKAVIEAWGLGPILGPIMAVVAGIAGAFQIAKIASQQIPAYEKGGVTGEGLALWGEKRPEVAVTKTGGIMYAENPTISKFDAGTRIYKSVEDFERNMIATNQKDFKFDYDKMASIMPETTINLDANGLWGIVNKHNERAILINRRYKIGR